MFYCDREHQSLKRKIKQSRRTELTESAKVMILDAEIDPSVVRMTKKQKSERALKELLDLNFPGIDHAEEENVEGRGVVGGTMSCAIVASAGATVPFVNSASGDSDEDMEVESGSSP